MSGKFKPTGAQAQDLIAFQNEAIKALRAKVEELEAKNELLTMLASEKNQF